MASANPAPYGFKPVGHLHGHVDFKQTIRPTGNVTKGRNPRQIRIGDIVALTSGGTIAPIQNGAGGISQILPLGVVGSIYNANSGRVGRPQTFSQPGAGPFVPVSTMAYVGVFEDPHIIYAANMSSTATLAQMGGFVDVRVNTAGITAAGRSGMSVTVTGGVVATADGQFLKLHSILSNDGALGEAPVCGQENQDVAVVMVNQAWSQPWFRNITAVVSDASALTE